MTEQTTSLTTKVEELRQKYNYQAREKPAMTQERATKTFDESAYHAGKESLRRISSSPTISKETSIGEVHKDMTAMNLELAELTEEYGQLNVNFQNVLSSEKFLTGIDVLKIGAYTAFRNKKAARQVKIDAAGRKGDSIAFLVGKLAEVMEKQYQKAIEGQAKAKQMQLENIAHMKFLDRKLIESLKSSNYTAVDQFAAQEEVVKIEKEISDIDALLMQYESQIRAAKDERNIEKVNKLSEEMSQVLDMKYEVLDGKLMMEGTVSEIRRQILDAAEGAQSAKGALAASWVNYQAISALEDSLSELEIKYKHALSDMIPVFRIQGKVAAVGGTALDIKDTLLKVAEKSNKLMEMNARLVMTLASETFNLLKTPVYDLEKARAVETTIRDYREHLNGLKMEWAENMTRIESISQQPHYAQHK